MKKYVLLGATMCISSNILCVCLIKLKVDECTLQVQIRVCIPRIFGFTEFFFS